jgi:hypothetical protein
MSIVESHYILHFQALPAQEKKLERSEKIKRLDTKGSRWDLHATINNYQRDIEDAHLL